ncbi:MAG: zinc metallopeptidase [Firmicutes bacterium]|jgi:Zn-dependent membrane protease YugP|nr:zinc metallopeptidase [Bacillota bacterium]MBR3394111.1 zinc metallopeptidase [Bacillota bacterium]
MIWFDSYYIILVLPTVIFALIAQGIVKSTYRKYSSVPTSRGLTGKAVAEMILQQAGIYDVPVEMTGGELSDHYDPSARVLRLSGSVFNGHSIAAIGVAAHECGHAIQHQDGYAPLSIRNAIIPATRIGSNLSIPLILIGVIIGRLSSQGMASDLSYYVIMGGIALFGLSVVFQLLTLPVEFNASRRALRILGDGMYLTSEELTGARKVLVAAALTYVAALAQALANLLRLILIYGGGRRRD